MTDKLLILEKINLSWNSFILWLLIAFQINSGSGGGGGGTGISSDGDDQMGVKRKTQKNPRTENLQTPKQSHAEFLKFSFNIKH